jgi:hypothetical protein
MLFFGGFPELLMKLVLKYIFLCSTNYWIWFHFFNCFHTLGMPKNTKNYWLDLTWLWYHPSNLRTLKWYRVAPVARISPEEANWTNEPRKQPTNYTIRDKRLFVSMSQQKASLNCQVLLLVTFLTKPLYSISNKKHSYHNQAKFS